MTEKQHTLSTLLSLFAVLQDMRIAWEEPFGPVIPVIRVKSIDDAIDHCNSNNLALQVCTRHLWYLWSLSAWAAVHVLPSLTPALT